MKQSRVDLNAVGQDGVTPIMRWAAEGRSVELQSAIQQNPLVDLDRTDNNKRTAMHWAAESGQTECVRVLRRNGASIDPRNAMGQTPLMEAVFEGQSACVGALVALGASVDSMETEDGNRPLMMAAQSPRSTEDAIAITKTLMGAGAKVDDQNKHGETALMHTVNFNPGMAEYLLKAGADWRIKDSHGKTAEDRILPSELVGPNAILSRELFAAIHAAERAAELDRKLDQACDSWSPPAASASTIKTPKANQDSLTQAEQQAPVSRSRQRF